MQVESVAKLGKSLSIRRETGEQDAPVVMAHLKFVDLIITREVIDLLCAQRRGWAEAALYDELGAPVAKLTLVLEGLALTVSGPIKGAAERNERLTLKDATLDDLAVSLRNNSALLNGSLSWLVAGDEISDLEPLLGTDCAVNWILSTGGQADLLKAA